MEAVVGSVAFALCLDVHRLFLFLIECILLEKMKMLRLLWKLQQRSAIASAFGECLALLEFLVQASVCQYICPVWAYRQWVASPLALH